MSHISSKSEGKFRWVTKREIIIVLLVAFGVFIAVCDKPVFHSGSFLFFRPALWDVREIDDGIMVTTPGGFTETDSDKITVLDVTEDAKEFESAKDYVSALITEKSLNKDFSLVELGEFGACFGQDAYFMMYKPGLDDDGEYVNSQIFLVIVKAKGKTFQLTLRSSWQNIDENLSKVEGLFSKFLILN